MIHNLKTSTLDAAVWLICNFVGLLYFIEIRSRMALWRLIAKRSLNQPGQKRIAFVSNWFGDNIIGGAENACLSLVRGMAEDSEYEVHVFTTTLQDFSHDWNQKFHEEGCSKHKDGYFVHRFDSPSVDRRFFHRLNGSKLMGDNIAPLERSQRPPVTLFEQYYFLKHMIFSPDLFKSLASNFNQFEHFVFMPYMFSSAVFGSEIVREKSIHIPCLHKERYVFCHAYKKMLQSSALNLYHVHSEMLFANQIYELHPDRQVVFGVQVDTNPPQGNADRFLKKYDIAGPYIIYVGRKVVGKNVPLMVDHFRRYVADTCSSLKLVMLGDGDLSYDDENIVEIGFVSIEDKVDAIAGAQALIQPSTNESFSIVLMEAWLQNRPVIVNGNCSVTFDHCLASEGGYSFVDYKSFKDSLDSCLKSSLKREEMGKRGRQYVLENYSKSSIQTKFRSALLKTETCKI